MPLRENSPISPHSLETFHLVKTEIWFQGSAGNLWLLKKKKNNRTFPSLSLLFLPRPPLPDKISFQVLLRMNQADDPDEYLLLPKETLCLCESINIKNQGHSACTQGRLWGFSHTWLRAQLCRLSHYGPECPAMGCSLHPVESTHGNLQQEGSGLDKRTQLKPDGLQDRGAFLLGERQSKRTSMYLGVFHICSQVLAHQVVCSLYVLSFFNYKMGIRKQHPRNVDSSNSGEIQHIECMLYLSSKPH